MDNTPEQQKIRNITASLKRCALAHDRLTVRYDKVRRAYHDLLAQETDTSEYQRALADLELRYNQLNLKCTEIIAQNIEHKKVLSSFDILIDV